MEKRNVYLDSSATTKVREEVLKEMLPYFTDVYGNASSVHTYGQQSKAALTKARETFAKLINAESPEEIIFTSCGTESDNIAIAGSLLANEGNHVITSKIEHHAVLSSCKTLEEEGFEVTYLDVDKNGLVNIDQLKNSIKKDTILISIMFANNEIGTIQPIKEIGNIAREHDIYFHTDAVQAIGNEIIDVKKLNIDALSMSAHKFYGPKGIGVLYVKNGLNFKKIQDGGHQEKDKRAGTENVPAIVGVGKAIEIAYEDFDRKYNYLKDLRQYCITRMVKEIPNIRINGDMNNRLVGNVNVTFKGVNGEALLYNLDRRGICASAGSACSSGTAQASHVLLAIRTNRRRSKFYIKIYFWNR